MIYGEYLQNAQGEDVVAGVRTPKEIAELERDNKAIYDELIANAKRLEDHYRDMQDIEFTIEKNKLFHPAMSFGQAHRNRRDSHRR